VDSSREAIRLAPETVQGYFNLALTYQAMGLSSESVRTYRQILNINSNHTVSWHNLGAALLSQNRFEQAATCFERALSIRPDYPEAHNSLSNIRRIQKKPAEAIALARKALELKPGFPDALAHSAVLFQQVCGWKELKETEPELTSQTLAALDKGEQPSETPLFTVGFRPDPEFNHAVARAWGLRLEERASRTGRQFDFTQRLKNRGRITVGYLSSDFRDHPVAHQIMGLPSAHDRSDFRIFCYSAGIHDDSHYRKHLERSCDKFVDIRNLQDQEAAGQIYNDGVDILVDLNGHTAGNRLGICALQPAPVQATFLGYPGTSGAAFFDYIVTDRIVTPENDLQFYSEKPVYLPNSYMITDDKQPISTEPLSRSDVGLPETGFIFCSFNSAYKFEPVLFNAWMSILKKVPDSCLWLPGTNDMVKSTLTTVAERNGISRGRILFASKLPSKADHLARLKLADMSLDTRIYNGHVSTCDALWAGVPVLTLTGRHFASRVSTSILKALDINETITGNIDEYVKTAVRFATEPQDLNRLREKIERHRLTQPLFNTGRWVRHLETAYLQMWRIYLEGAEIDQISIGQKINRAII
jgi:protein O-GlcNAc transferase